MKSTGFWIAKNFNTLVHVVKPDCRGNLMHAVPMVSRIILHLPTAICQFVISGAGEPAIISFVSVHMISVVSFLLTLQKAILAFSDLE